MYNKCTDFPEHYILKIKKKKTFDFLELNHSKPQMIMSEVVTREWKGFLVSVTSNLNILKYPNSGNI